MTFGILFDFNGVIVDDEAQHCDALMATLAGYGYTLTREAYYREYLGLDDRECFRLTFRRLGFAPDEEEVRRAVSLKHAAYQQALAGPLHLVPGVSDFIENAALDGFQLAIVSGALRSEIEAILNETELRPHFAEIIAAEDVEICKPDPSGFNRARSMLELTANRCVVLEDSLPGLHAARAAGLRCTMLATSHSEATCREADLVWNDFVGHDPAELPWAHV
jgi:HAD superfamily hydrolase (TIGR01509 family)